MWKLLIAIVIVFLSVDSSFSQTSSTNTTVQSAYDNDNTVLNYALTLELLEKTFYKQNLRKFTQATFVSAGYTATDYSYFKLILAHEKAHVSALTSLLKARGATPVSKCTYNFNVSTISDFVMLAKTLENTGTQAYDGAVDKITDRTLLAAAATIATVEARHAGWLNLLNNQVPFPDSFEPAQQPAQVAADISALLVSCPQQLPNPQPANNFFNLTLSASS